MVRPPERFVELAKRYVCVRITDMADVDLGLYRFDFDLTFAVLFLNADGTVYHRYGGRDHHSALSWMSLPSLLKTMEETLEDHRAHVPSKMPPKKTGTVYDIPSFARRHANRRKPERGGKPTCVHCHEIFPALRREALEKKTWAPEDIWVWPSPARVGLELDPEDQTRIARVIPDSVAAKAKLAAGDRLISHAGRRLRTVTDLQDVLDRAPRGEHALTLRVRRDATERDVELALPAGWKVGTPLTFSWRASKWELSPAPGFGGKMVPPNKRRKLGVPEDAFGLRVTYRVIWGERAHLGRNAGKAGLRKGDIVLSVAGKSDFASENHFHAWYRLTRRVGEKVAIEILRDGERRTLELTVIE